MFQKLELFPKSSPPQSLVFRFLFEWIRASKTRMASLGLFRNTRRPLGRNRVAFSKRVLSWQGAALQIKGVGSGGKEQRTSSNRLSGSCSGMSLYQPGLSLHPVSWLSHHFSCLELIPKESAEGKLWRRREGRTVYLQLREGCIRPLVEGEGRRGESLDRLLGSGGSLVYNGLVTLDCKAVPFLEMGWVGGWAWILSRPGSLSCATILGCLQGEGWGGRGLPQSFPFHKLNW